MSLLRIAAIDFLNPAPLMWDFEHEPQASRLATRYSIERMTPALCARQLASGEADIGLIPVATYAQIPGLSIIPGCTIASLDAIRSLLLVIRAPLGDTAAGDDADLITDHDRERILSIKRVALDTSSRTSAAYTQILFRKYWGVTPQFVPHAPELDHMLATADAALLIGDPALRALEDRAVREQRTGERLRYLDLGHAWRTETGLPWISAFWAVRTASLEQGVSAKQVVEDFLASRDAGLRNIAALTGEWSARLGLPAATVATYLTKNIHYVLDEACLSGLRRFYEDAFEVQLLPKVPELVFL